MDLAPTFPVLLTRIAPDAGGRAVALALIVAGIGLFLWVMGARVSRSLFTLAGVTVGTWAGMHLPRRMGWEIDSMATAIGGALVAGLAGYLLHMLWVGLTLGTLLASAGVAVAWHRLAAGASWSPPAFDPATPVLGLVRDHWHTLPNGLSRVLPVVAGFCFASGALAAMLSPKFARVLAFSLLGSLMLTAGGLAAAALTRPDWLERIPPSTQTQGVILATLVMLGAAIQWAMCPRMRKPGKPKASIQAEKPAQPSPRASLQAPRAARDSRRFVGSTPLGPLQPKEVRA